MRGGSLAPLCSGKRPANKRLSVFPDGIPVRGRATAPIGSREPQRARERIAHRLGERTGGRVWVGRRFCEDALDVEGAVAKEGQGTFQLVK